MAADAPMPVSQMRILALFGAVAIYGSERGNLEVLAALRDQGAKVLVVVSDADYAAEAGEYIRARGFETVAAPFFVPPRPDYPINPWTTLPVHLVRAARRFLAIHREFRPTHIHAGTQLYVLNFMPALALVRTPLVYRCGDAPILHNLVWRLTWRFIARRTARFASVSRYIAGLMARAGAPAERIEVIYSRPPQRTTGAAPIPPPAGQTIAYVGQVTEKKGIAVLVQAFERLAADYPEARLLVAGRISEWIGDRWGWELKRRVEADPLIAGRVEFLGQVEDVPGVFARSLIAVAPTLSEEPMGNVVMEAKQAGRASIIFRAGGFPEVVRHGVDGFICEEKTSEALEQALRGYLDDPAAAARQGEAARASLSALGVEDFAARWGAIYADAAL
ncbi:MAG TPA: glycosyltransferase family 4 protein [Caulobacter sp.]|nr:glycosyltransferase family 4 protein [Caulobacter sp.]